MNNVRDNNSREAKLLNYLKLIRQIFNGVNGVSKG